MASPIAQTSAEPDFDTLTHDLERGARAQQVLALGVGADLTRRRDAVLTTAENELRAGMLTPERALMHIACCNALRKYQEELTENVNSAQRAAHKLHADVGAPTEDGA